MILLPLNKQTVNLPLRHAGERVVKRGQHSETLYLNRFYSVRSGELGTKHVFAGETRVLSKLVKTPPTVDINPGIVPSEIPGQKGILNALGRGKGNKFGIFKRLDREGVPLPGTLPVEKDQFYYHGDHLGSSNMITDIAGAVYQHLEYFPYGETWIEEGGSYGGNTPGYKFTGKELDPETGLYYFGARYYDAVLSKWISADPFLGKFLPTGNRDRDQRLPGMGGVFNPINLSVYTYASGNPVKFLDPDGLETKYFVIHSTGGELSKKTILGYTGHQGKAHAYIMRSGELINIIPFDKTAWATKQEKQNKSLRGSMYHVELNYAEGGSPSNAQYGKLAETYKQLSADAAKKGDDLAIVPHKEVDRGLKSGHSDPENFDFNKFYDVLKGQGVDVDKVKKITQERYLIPSQADQKSNWPPVLSGPAERKKADE